MMFQPCQLSGQFFENSFPDDIFGGHRHAEGGDIFTEARLLVFFPIFLMGPLFCTFEFPTLYLLLLISIFRGRDFAFDEVKLVLAACGLTYNLGSNES